MTLQNKIRYHYVQLQDGRSPTLLRESLMLHIITFYSDPQGKSTFRYLAMCIATLAAQVNVLITFQ